MDCKFVMNRITSLRLEKNVSEYKMSLDLGQNRSYIQSISSGRAMPSMKMFFDICDYFEITPAEFFDEELNEKILYCKKLSDKISKLSDEDINLIERLTDRFGSNDNGLVTK